MEPSGSRCALRARFPFRPLPATPQPKDLFSLVISFRPFLHDHAVRLAADTTAAILILIVGLGLVAGADGSSIHAMIGGPLTVITAGRLIHLGRAWYHHAKPEQPPAPEPAAAEPVH